MSYVAVIVGVVILILGNINNWVAATILFAKSRQSDDPNTKRSLLAAFYFALLTLPFTILVLVFGFRALATRGCKKRPRWILILSIIFIVIALIVVIVISKIFANRAAARGDTDSARDLNAAYSLLIAATILNIIGFIILYATIGKRFSRIGRTCQQVRSVTG